MFLYETCTLTYLIHALIRISKKTNNACSTAVWPESLTQKQLCHTYFTIHTDRQTHSSHSLLDQERGRRRNLCETFYWQRVPPRSIWNHAAACFRQQSRTSLLLYFEEEEEVKVTRWVSSNFHVKLQIHSKVKPSFKVSGLIFPCIYFLTCDCAYD